MERNLNVNNIVNACPFIHPKTKKVVFPFEVLRDMVVLWQFAPAIKLGKGILAVPKGFEDRYTVGVGVILAIGPGYHDKREKWIPVDELLVPGTVVEYDKTIPWVFPQKVEDIKGALHTLPTCPSVNIFGVYEKEGA